MFALEQEVILSPFLDRIMNRGPLGPLARTPMKSGLVQAGT